MKPIRKATRTSIPLKILLSSPPGGGKTYSALTLSAALCPTGKIVVVDSEHRRSEMYADEFTFDILELELDTNGWISPAQYCDAIIAAHDAKYDVIIIDSATHEWEAVQGYKDKLDAVPNSNKWTNWLKPKAAHDRFMKTLEQLDCHCIVTVRSKMAYEQQEVNGKRKVIALGMAPQQESNFAYEFMLHLGLEQETHCYTVNKDNTHLFRDEDGGQRITAKTGKMLADWLASGAKKKEDP